MVSFWPFGRSEDNSLDSFERILSKLAAQIQTQTSKLALLRQHSRRYKGLFTLYTVFAWILYVVVIVVVIGWKEANPFQLAGIVGGPVGIWSVRRLLDLYYNSKISNTESKLEDLQSKQRDTVEKLKAATKFSTTQSIIEKYGGGSTTSADTEWEGQQQLQGGLQGHPNNQTPRQRPQGQSSRGTPPIPTTPQQIQQQLVQQQLMAQQRMTQQQQLRPSTSNPNPVQKPNASAPTPVLNLLQTTTQPSSQQHIQPEEATAPRWYDRLLDVLVGEDETSAKNRYTLICKNCRMVNGLAPPGIRNLEDIEGWGCARCGTVNGRLPSRPPSRRQEEEVEETHVVPDSEARNPKNRKSKSPTPNENVRTTRSKAKKEEVEDTDEGSGEESSEEGGSGEEEEKIPEPPKPKPKGRVTRGKRKV